MEKRTNASRVVLDWRRLLGFDQASSADSAASAVPLSPKIGPKEARGFGRRANPMSAKVGVKTVRFGPSLPISVTAKIGSKDNPSRP